jgi:hypothetical protein
MAPITKIRLAERGLWPWLRSLLCSAVDLCGAADGGAEERTGGWRLEEAKGRGQQREENQRGRKEKCRWLFVRQPAAVCEWRWLMGQWCA